MQLGQNGTKHCSHAPTLLSLLLVLCLPVLGQAASPYEAVQQGNALYQRGAYAEAAQQYATAGQALPDAAEIHFNQGNAAYKQQDYRKALEHYAQALQTAGRQLEGKVKYNLGNVEYQQALRNLQRPQEALPRLRSAMTYYRDSLDVDPQQQDARYNLELSHLLLHKLQQEQRQPQPQGQPQQEQQQDQQAQQDGQQSQSTQQQDAQQQSEQQQAQPQGQPQSASQAQPEQPPEASQANAQPPEQQTAAPQELRPEEASHLLEAIRERAREADQRRQQRRAKARASRVDKDW